MPPPFVITFPTIDPVAFTIGPLQVRWYAIAYIVGLILSVAYAKSLLRNAALWEGKQPPATPRQIEDLLLWIAVGVVVGGRLGYVLFYNLGYFLINPDQVVQMWQGGMSFHGGFLGVIVACWAYGYRHGIALDRLLDLSAAAVPIGLFLGRIANFVNGELYGRVTDVPWAMVFPQGGPLARHPSQLYEAALEGVVLFLALRLATHRYHSLAHPGLTAGLFALGYGIARFLVEFAREPDTQIGMLAGGWLTMGMLLSLPMMAVGLWLIWRARRTP